MSKISIKAAFADEISRVLHHNTSKPSQVIEHYEVEVNNDNKKEEIAELFNTCVGFEIVSDMDEYGNDEGGYILFTMKKTQEEIDKLHIEFEEDRKNHIVYCIRRLKKWCDNKVEDKEQIEVYLKFKKLDWILDKINS